MPSPTHEPVGFDSLAVGAVFRSPARTITETDLVMFAGLTGDFDPLHVDHEHARRSPFGKPIAHGMLGISLVAGLGSHSPWVHTAAFTRIVEWQFVKPIYIGDTVHVVTTVLEKRPRARRRGLVTWRRELVNQHGEVVQHGTWETLVLRAVAAPALADEADELSIKSNAPHRDASSLGH
jgi:3-hydroxybutyryl-CoA dehydratase